MSIDFSENSIIQRVILLRTQFAGPRGKSKFAQTLGISPSTYNYYEQDRLAPIPVLLKICEITGADLNWLLTGVHYSNSSQSQNNQDSRLISKIQDMLASNPCCVSALEAFVDLLISDRQNQKQRFETTFQARNSLIPVLGRTAAGMVGSWDQTMLKPDRVVTELSQLVEKYTGTKILENTTAGIQIDFSVLPSLKELKNSQASLVQVQSDLEISQFIECNELAQKFPDCFALQVDGDSMAPRIRDGHLVILSPSIPAIDGQAAVVHIKNQIGVTCKLIRHEGDTVHLIPINEKFETKVVPREKLNWALAVLCHINI
jgi:SOS-response transcriptional repressor LexA